MGNKDLQCIAKDASVVRWKSECIYGNQGMDKKGKKVVRSVSE